MREYVTEQGDTWDMVCCRLYPESGGELNMSRLIMANSSWANTAIFRAGVILDVPDEMPREDIVLPPWRR